jgi:fructose-1-phosphate kinase PfkB-like protein
MGHAALILAGTMPAHGSQDFYPDLIRASDGPVLLDTSGATLLRSVMANPDVVKINTDELCATFGRKACSAEDVVSMSRTLIEGGAGAVGVTAGAEDAYLVTPDGAWRFSIPGVAVVSPLGSGDSVNAGLVTALLEGRNLLDAFAFGLAAGSANAETEKPGHLERDRVEALCAVLQPVAL